MDISGRSKNGTDFSLTSNYYTRLVKIEKLDEDVIVFNFEFT